MSKISVIPRKRTDRETYIGKYMYAYLNRMSSIEKFHEILLSGFRRVLLTNCFSMGSEGALIPGKIISDRIVVEKFLLLKNCRYNEFERYWHEIYDKLVME